MSKCFLEYGAIDAPSEKLAGLFLAAVHSQHHEPRAV